MKHASPRHQIIASLGTGFLAASLTLAAPKPAAADSVIEDFQLWPTQNDNVGVFDPIENETIFRVTASGDPNDPTVAEAAEALATATGIDLVFGDSNQWWTIDSGDGMTFSIDTQSGYLMIADIPGFSTPRTGPFASFFSTPRDLSGATIRAKVRRRSGVEATQFRFLVFDTEDDEAASAMMSLTSVFQTFSVPVGPATFPDFQNQGPTNFDRITGISLEFFVNPAQPTTVGALQFNVDDVEVLNVPEPSTLLLHLACGATVAGLARRRRAHQKP